jgi:hypothetical protein
MQNAKRDNEEEAPPANRTRDDFQYVTVPYHLVVAATGPGMMENRVDGAAQICLGGRDGGRLHIKIVYSLHVVLRVFANTKSAVRRE